MKSIKTIIKTLILLISVFALNSSFAQTSNNWECGTIMPDNCYDYTGSCIMDPTGSWLIYNDPHTFTPYNDNLLLHNSPIKTIEVNFNIFQRSDGTGNYQNTPEDKAWLISILEWVNSFYSAYHPSDPIAGV